MTSDNTHKWYFELYTQYSEKFGKDTIILMQIGSFYEIYSLNLNYMEKISHILKMRITQKNKSKGYDISIKSPYMIGFPDYMIEKYIKIIIETNYTIVQIDQTSASPKPSRDIVGIYSKGTYIDNESISTNSLLSIYIEKVGKKKIYSFASINLSIGSSMLFETVTDKLTDDILKFIEISNPVEIIINGDEYIWDLNGIIHYNTISDNSISYQETFLNKIFTDTGLLSPIEYIGLNKYPNLCLSYVGLLEFAYQHDINILNKIKTPYMWEDDTLLHLNNNSLYQLNVLSYKSEDKCLLTILDKTSTVMGKRLLKWRLLNPIIDDKELNNRYKLIENMWDKYLDIEKHLKGINDFERIARRIVLNKFDLFELINMNYSLESCLELFKLWENNELYSEFKLFYDEYLRVFDIKNMCFNKNIYPKLDNFNKNIEQNLEKLEIIKNELNTILKIEFNKKSKNKRQKFGEILLKKTEGNEYYFETTNTRLKYIEDYLNDNNFNFKKKGNGKNSNIKINRNDIEIISHTLIGLHQKKQIYFNKIYKEKLEQFDINLFWKLSEYVGEVDFIKSCTKMAIKNAYVKPKITIGNKSFIKATNMRHPIIDIIQDKIIYIPNDVDLNNLLLFGINGSGKSSYMKAVGLNIIMAQCGMFVPCSELNIGLYKKIFTRISGDDNIYRGMSSFEVEMNELKEIIERCDNRSLVLGDEVCRGTETASAIAIVLSSLRLFVKKNVGFIFASHLHELMNYNLDGIQISHLTVDCTDGLVYERKLKNGSGECEYGIEVMKYLFGKNTDFVKNTLKIRGQRKVISHKKSRYNSEIYVDTCAICNKPGQDVHHIKYQKDCDSYGLVGAIRKNMKGNLVVLCKQHHIAVHKNEYKIYGYKNTSSGIILDWIKSK